MLFNSYIFICVHLPLTLLGFFILGRIKPHFAAAWLCAMSFVFYGWAQITLVPLLLGSALFNFGVSILIQKNKRRAAGLAKGFLVFGIVGDLGLLGYFKYADFFVHNLNDLLNAGIAQPQVLLPLGISFFTFTQLAYLVDCYKKDIREYSLTHYLLFVTYFPHLVAGPILHHSELMPQFARRSIYTVDISRLALGITIFIIGLFKKLVIADGVSAFVGPVFHQAAIQPVSFSAGWLGAIAYSLQIYFDFSGYSDMAIGISAMFGILLPVNFWSPYKATSIIDFWRRWHITLSRFLRDYLYIPLGGNRAGATRRYANLMITMLLGGLWHGASWTFVAWGGLHGAYLMINHAWRWLRAELGLRERHSAVSTGVAIATTYFAVVFAWVLFRAESLGAVNQMLRGMLGYHHLVKAIAHARVLDNLGGFGRSLHAAALASRSLSVGDHWELLPWLAVGATLAFAMVMPNTIQLLRLYVIALPTPFRRSAGNPIAWNFTWPWLAFDIVLAAICFLSLSTVSPFLYYRF